MILRLFLIVALALPQLAGAAPPSCRPAELAGPGTKILTRDEPDVGSCYVGWWCPPATSGPWSFYGHCVLTQYKQPYVYQAYAKALAVGDLEGMWASFTSAVTVVPKPGAETDAWNGLFRRFMAQAEAVRPPAVLPPPPPPPAWVVDVPTAADGTRPAFPFVDGVRKSASTGRAKSGEPCKPEVAQAVSGLPGKVFAAYGPAFVPGMVALCKRP
jgi:hypothetical protein